MTSTTKKPAESEEILVSAVIPCLNEERSIGICVQKARDSFAALGVAGEVVVVDNGSTDLSAQVARDLGARVVPESVKGYGKALQTGIEASRGRIIVMGDADDSYDWSAIGPFILKVQEGYDFVGGNRFKGGILPGAMPALHRYFGNPVLSALIRLVFGVKLGDVQCGMRAFTREAYARMRTAAPGMEFVAEMVIAAAHQGLRIAEVPTRLYPDKRGRPPHLRTFRDGWRNLRLILTHAPEYLYLGPGAVLLTAGLLLQLLLVAGPVELGGAYFGIHYVALGGMLALVGFNIINLGVLAKAVMEQRYPELRSRVLRLLTGRYTLEVGLIAGAVLMTAGLVADAAILAHRLAHPNEAMEGTVHLAFVATTAVVLGLNLMFSSFLLAMMLASRDGRP
ncbi:MAG TPA: glycosyltransferase family 2 protein [Burkholderiales bacterium]|nr:glycosyltransferase family 2 protein [Burkholderiales bacterium]